LIARAFSGVIAALTVLNDYPYYRSLCKGDMLPWLTLSKTILLFYPVPNVLRKF